MKGINQYSGENESSMFRAALVAILVVCTSLGLIGCASVNPEPFTKFANSVQNAQTGANTVMSINYDWTKSAFIDGFANDANSKFSKLIIRPGAGYDWTIENPPLSLYLDVKRVRAALADINFSFSMYVTLLSKLADSSLVDVKTFDQLTKELNENTSDVIKSLKPLNVSVPDDGKLFSTAAAEAARLYIENKRQSYLKEAIQKNQSNVEDYSKICIYLIHTICGSIKTYYNEKMEPIEREWQASTGETRIKKTEQMLTLNEQFIGVLKTLQELEEVYKSLPQAHSDLAEAIGNPKFDMRGIQHLYLSSQRLQRTYTELTKDGK